MNETKSTNEMARTHSWPTEITPWLNYRVQGFFRTREITMTGFVLQWYGYEWPCILQFSWKHIYVLYDYIVRYEALVTYSATGNQRTLQSRIFSLIYAWQLQSNSNSTLSTKLVCWNQKLGISKVVASSSYFLFRQSMYFSTWWSNIYCLLVGLYVPYL